MESTYFNTYSLSIIILFSNGLNGSYCFNSFGGEVFGDNYVSSGNIFLWYGKNIEDINEYRSIEA